MPAYSITSNTTTSTQGPKLKKGLVRIRTSTDIYWMIGENPTASKTNCAILRAGDTLELRLPVNCSKLSVLAIKEPGAVTIIDITGGARSSCSA